MKIFVSAAEISSDLQAEKILREFIKLFPAETIEIAGIGGPKLRTLAGFQVVEKAENLRAMGFTEVLAKIFKIKKILNHTISFLESYQPDLILTFDYPDFHFALLNACAKIPILNRAKKICGIPPKLWVWRSKRIEKIRNLYDAVWVLFPFEKTLYESAGIPVIYEGNPLMAEVMSHELAQKPEWNTKEQITIAVMPGSREAEIREHLKVIPKALQLLSEKCGKRILAEVPVPVGISAQSVSQKLRRSTGVSYRFYEGSSHAVLARNSVGLIKSGTSTLEAAMLGCVPVIFYRVSFISRLIFQFVVRYKGAVGLPNILLGVKERAKAIFPELLGPEANPEALSRVLYSLIENASLVQEKQKVGEQLRSLLIPQLNISEKIAVQFKRVLEEQSIRPVIREKRLWISVVSFLWSLVNLLRRKLYSLGILKTHTISIPSILVGNLQAGGSGKTPLVIAIASEAVKRGYQVGVISRAYGIRLQDPYLLVGPDYHLELHDRPDLIGDEPAEILAAVPEVTLGLGKDRVLVSQALEVHGIDFLIFDDGFQNLKFKTKKTILAVTDALPSEVVYRDFLSAASGATLVLQTKGFPKPAPIKSRSLLWHIDSLPTGPIWLMCAVGDPLEVVQFYKNYGVQIERVFVLPDHAAMDLVQVKRWTEEARASGAVFAVTQKDWVKMKTDSSLTPFVLKRKIVFEDWLDALFER